MSLSWPQLTEATAVPVPEKLCRNITLETTVSNSDVSPTGRTEIIWMLATVPTRGAIQVYWSMTWRRVMVSPATEIPNSPSPRTCMRRASKLPAGTCTVLQSGAKFTKLAENKLPGTFYSTPAISAGTIFLRSEDTVYAVGK